MDEADILAGQGGSIKKQFKKYKYVQNNFIIYNKCIKWNFAFWVTQVPPKTKPKTKDSQSVQHNKMYTNEIKRCKM